MTPNPTSGPRWLDAHEWDRVVEGSPGGTGFQTRGWVEARAELDPRYRARCLAIPFEDGAVGALPLLVRRGTWRFGPMRRAVASSPNAYGGPLRAGRALDAADWRAVGAALADLGLGRVDCFGNPLEPALRGWGELPGAPRGATQVIELDRPLEELESAFSSGARRSVRRSAREDVAVAREDAGDALPEYGEIYRDSLRRWGKGEAQGESPAVLRRLLQVPAAELWTARSRAGRLAAGAIVLFTRAHALYWHGATLLELAEVRPAHALHRALIAEAQRRGCRVYDLGSSIDMPGVERFKASLGARKVEFAGWRHVHPALARVARWRARPSPGAGGTVARDR